MTYLFKIDDVPRIMKMDKPTVDALFEMGLIGKKDFSFINAILMNKPKEKVSKPDEKMRRGRVVREKPKEDPGETCPGCSANMIDATFLTMSPFRGRYQMCPGCDGLIGNVGIDEAYDVVKGEWEKDGFQGESQYYHITIDDNGKTRTRHGWFNPQSGKIVQTG